MPEDVLQKNMLDGVGYYFNDNLILILVEGISAYDYKGVSYPFKIWNGCIFPIQPIKQDAVFAKFTFLENHPAYKKGLYLPADAEDFEQNVKLVIREIKKKNPLFGLPIIAKKSYATDYDEVDTSKPRLFGDVPKTINIDKPNKKDIKPLKKSQIKKNKSNKKSENNFILNILKK